MSLKKKSTKIPTKVLNQMKENGALVDKLEGEDLYSVTDVVYGDKAWKVYEDWGNNIDGNPIVLAGFFPSKNIVGSVLCPDDAVCFQIQRDANSIIHYYAPLRRDIFQDNDFTKIGPPLHAPRMGVSVHHAKIALSKIPERIRTPPDDYPALRSLKSGSYICNIQQTWANTVVNVVLFKP